MQCEHKQSYLKSIEETTFEWCTMCGTIIHHIKIGGVFKQVESGIYCDFSNQTDGFYYMNAQDFRYANHKHNWFLLETDHEWCKICGALQIRRLVANKGFSIAYKKGILLPKKREARIEILKEAGLV